MILPAISQPSVETISSELVTWHRWASAYYQKESPLPVLPERDDASSAIILCGFIVRFPLHVLGWLTRKTGLHSLRQWCAAMLVRSDWMAACRASCSLNRAFTELGLSLFNANELALATDCLSRSWRVHPCPHNTSFGLCERLWVALAGIPEADAAREEYEKVARSFAPGFCVPSKQSSLLEVLREVLRTVTRREGSS